MKKSLKDDKFHEAMRNTGDPPADETIEKISKYGDGISQVNKILHDLILSDHVDNLVEKRDDQLWAMHLDVPNRQTQNDKRQAAKEIGGALRDYLQESGKLPPWAEPDSFATSEKVFAEYGMMAFSILGCAS